MNVKDAGEKAKRAEEVEKEIAEFAFAAQEIGNIEWWPNASQFAAKRMGQTGAREAPSELNAYLAEMMTEYPGMLEDILAFAKNKTQKSMQVYASAMEAEHIRITQVMLGRE